jgi:hypothetical protein
LVKRVYKTGFAPLLLLLLAGSGHAQSPPLPGPPSSNLPPPIVGFVSPYEIMRTLRAAGFEPLSPPLREGTDYVLRATDFRGILMHVVVDAHTAAIRDVTRIVPGPGRYGQYYGAPPYGAAPYGPEDFGPPLAPPTEASIEAPPPMRPLAPAPRAVPEVPSASPPLPRPRPATLASRKSDSADPAATPLPPASIKTEPRVAAPAVPAVAPSAAVTPSSGGATATVKPAATTPDGKAQINSEVITAAPPPASAAPKKAPIPVEPLND